MAASNRWLGNPLLRALLGDHPEAHRRLGWFGVALTAGILLAGLWPLRFSAPNNAGWVSGKTGLHFSGGEARSQFDPGGIAFTPQPLTAPSGVTAKPGELTIELWLRPAREPEGARSRILSVRDTFGTEFFFVGQWSTQLLIWVREADTGGPARFRELEVREAMATNRLSFVTITSDRTGTAVSVNGALAKRWSNARLLPEGETLTGQRLFLGNSAEGVTPWAGEIFGLAVRGQALAAEQVRESWLWWTNSLTQPPPFTQGLLALYDLRRGHGGVVPNAVGVDNPLFLPRELREQKPFLAAPDWSHLGTRDFVLNFLGFVPFGFCVAAWLGRARPNSRLSAVGAAIVAGAVLSLVIELVQVALPTRDSSLADLICNTAGTVLGALLAGRRR